MQFRDLKQQYQVLKKDIDQAMEKVATDCNFISGAQVADLEKKLAEYVGVKHCVTCANGTDALSIAMMTWEIGCGDAVFVPDFTFFSSGEIVSHCGATPVFVDVDEDTYNISPGSLEAAIEKVIKEDKLTPKVIVAVDLFGLPADFTKIRPIAEKYGLLVLEDGAQGFGGRIGDKVACSFGDISTTSFFPAKPLGCYGDGGAVFTDNDEWADLMRSIRVHGKGAMKYDNIRIGLNSRLDTIQAAVLSVKLRAFREYELDDVNRAAERYTELLSDIVKTPIIPDRYYSGWAQYTIQLSDRKTRDRIQAEMKEAGIPTMVYYPKPMHKQLAFGLEDDYGFDCSVTERLCDTVLSLPMHPYLTEEDIKEVTDRLHHLLQAK
ncbi:MAG TPA: DegT/DnrJ/EryC1/StrS family aminotransferase [Candidatus Fimisoma avicola]|uniref:DegT/DnrJ/EryC1/StrS family aminotransferase n=1 Tax=Candidatus Fimisoma avicola TaxID=2840826 RepID=A0A9D1I5Z8_9FIRM|nr:DegT/DnrJ/EryC1/StrS family aminotransferase [Candidatus Fimisoma avicola]